MADIRLAADTGRAPGTRSSKRLRRAGKIPAIVYGHGMGATSIAVDGRDLRHALSGAAGLNAVLTIELGGEEHMALARQIQRHPTRQTVTHVDFLVVDRYEVINSEVPITLVGEAKDLGSEGVIEQVMTSLTVQSTPGNIPNGIEVDISDLHVGEHVSVAELRLPSGVATEVDPTELVVTAKLSAVSVEVEAEEAEALAAAEGGDLTTESGSE
jgi:large subunit ribosomal protein L25